MKKYLKILFLAVLFSFIWGAWWGFFNLEKRTPRFKKGPEIRLLARQGFFPPSFLEDFHSVYQVQIVLTEKNSESEILREALSNNQSYDLIQVDSFIAKSFILENVFFPLELDEITHFKDISIDFKNFDFDPDNKYLLPVSWGLNGFLVNTNRVTLVKESLNELMDAKAKFSIIESPVEIYNLAIKLKPIIKNWVETGQSEELHKDIKEIRSRFTHLSNDPRAKFQDGSLDVAQIASGKAAKIIDADSHWRFVLPREGSTLWVGLLGISRGARDVEFTHQVLNRLLSSKSNRNLIEMSEQSSVLESLNTSDLPSLQKAEYIRHVPLSRVELFINHEAFEPIWSQALRKEWSEFAR